MGKIRVIVAGGRDFNNYKLLEKTMHETFKLLSDNLVLSGNADEDVKNIEIVSGCCDGADILGEKFAKEYGINVVPFPAEWDDLEAQPCVVRVRTNGSQYNVLAGYNSNAEMARYTSQVEHGILVAFWDGKSTGTKNMIDVAMRYDLDVIVKEY